MTPSSATPVRIHKTVSPKIMLVSTWQIGLGITVLTITLTNASNFFKGNADADPELKTNLNGNTLFTVELVLNLEVTFSNNATHVEDTFRKCVRLSFYVKKLQKL